MKHSFLRFEQGYGISLRPRMTILAAAIIGLLLWLPHPALAQNADGSCASQACVTTGPRLGTLDSTQSNLLDASTLR